jgi:predicted acyl esterase
MEHQRRDAYWQQGSVCQDFSRIQIPVYAASGWADNYSESIPRLLAGLTCPRLGLIGPWAHSFPHDVTVQPAIGWLQEAVRWLDHWLKGRDTGIMSEPMLRVWMQDPVPPQSCYTTRPGRWVGEPIWPSPHIQPLAMPLNPGNLLGGPPTPGQAQINSPLWVGLEAGEVGRYGEDADWPGDQRSDDAGSLVFTTPPLDAPVEIMGAALVNLHFTSDRPLALVAIRLNDVAPDGRSLRVALGVLNLTHRDAPETPEPLVPGQLTTACVELDDIAHHFPAGHRIAVSISTTYWPIAWPSPERATLTLTLGDSHLVLPRRPPRPEDADLRPFDPPEQAPQVPTIHHPSPPGHPRRVTRDLLTGRTTVDFPRWTYQLEMPDISTTTTSEGYARFHLTGDDPLTAETVCEYKVTLSRPEVVAGHHSWTRMTCDATHFHLETRLRVSENGTEIFRRDWQRSFPRDHL